MDMDREPGTCTPCPLNSHTLTEASTNKQQCVCMDDYTGPAGGPCIGMCHSGNRGRIGTLVSIFSAVREILKVMQQLRAQMVTTNKKIKRIKKMFIVT